MAYENHMPPLSTINQGTRDFDFIPLTELKEFDEKLWELAREQAIKEYEEEYGSWEDADKYEKEDLVFSAYMKLKTEKE